MAIKSRDSNDHLHTDVILGKITEYDIFMYYIPSFKELRKKFKSELRDDNSPTVYITMYNGKLLYKDFGNSDHTFDCFNYVKYKYGCSFIDALRIIDCDFNLGLSSQKSEIEFTMGYMAYRQKYTPKITKTEIDYMNKVSKKLQKNTGNTVSTSKSVLKGKPLKNLEKFSCQFHTILGLN